MAHRVQLLRRWDLLHVAGRLLARAVELDLHGVAVGAGPVAQRNREDVRHTVAANELEALARDPIFVMEAMPPALGVLHLVPPSACVWPRQCTLDCVDCPRRRANNCGPERQTEKRKMETTAPAPTRLARPTTYEQWV